MSFYIFFVKVVSKLFKNNLLTNTLRVLVNWTKIFWHNQNSNLCSFFQNEHHAFPQQNLRHSDNAWLEVKKRKESKPVMEHLTTKVMFVQKKCLFKFFDWFSLFLKKFRDTIFITILLNCLIVSDKWLLYYITNCLGRNPTSRQRADLVPLWNLRVGATSGPNSSSSRNLTTCWPGLMKKK